MTDAGYKALLPAGMRDLLPPDAAHEAAVVERLLALFAARGYERVKPPFVEFEESLLGGAGAAMAGQTFRLMDPVSHRMMGVRADMTLQIARIATTRLANAPRPLRLGYTGEVLHVKGSQLRPERQFRQVGVELIGARQPTADAEIVLLAAHGLAAIGVEAVSVDLSMPTLVPAVCRALEVPAREAEALRQALDRRDAAAVATIGGPAAPLVASLLAATGTAARAVAALAGLALPAEAEPDRARLVEVVRRIASEAPGLAITVDPVERRGFEYQTGLSFTLFARGIRGELGRGGRYRAGNGASGADSAAAAAEPAGEPATGFTLFMDTVLRAVPGPRPAARVFVPLGTTQATAETLRAAGWTTVAGLEPVADVVAEARRLGCGHVLEAGTMRAVDERAAPSPA